VEWTAALPKTCIGSAVRKQVVIPVTRYEYKNLFHQMTDFINTFMVGTLAGVDFNDVQVREQTLTDWSLA